MAFNSGSLNARTPNVFSLGGVTFSLDEAPEDFKIPSVQSLAIHDHIGGKRKIQALGVVWKQIRWEGQFWGVNAEYRARLLARMKAEAKVHRLIYLSYALDVVIEEFTPSYVHQMRCGYEIAVQVLRDVSGVVTIAATQSVDKQIQSSVVKADALIAKMDTNSASAVRPSFQAMNTAIDKAGPAAQAKGLVSQEASASITKAIADAQSVLSIPPVTSTTASLLNVTQYLNFLNIVQKNFDRGQSPKSISVDGGSLFSIAAQYYGDPGLATAIQTANGLTSTDLPSGKLTDLKLPPL